MIGHTLSKIPSYLRFATALFIILSVKLWAIPVKINDLSDLKTQIRKDRQLYNFIFANQEVQTEVREIINQLEKSEDPVQVLNEYMKFCKNSSKFTVKSSEDFINSRNYINKAIGLKANPINLDEAAKSVEAKIFKSTPKKEVSQDSINDNTSSEEQDFL